MIGFRPARENLIAWVTPDEAALIASAAHDTITLLRQAAGSDGFDDESSAPNDVSGADPDDSEPTLEEMLMASMAAQDRAMRPSDPALRRLLPDGSDDEVVATQFRQLTQADLVERKFTRLARLINQLEEAEEREAPFMWVVHVSDAESVAAAISDMRLVLGDQLGVVDEATADRIYERVVDPAADPTADYSGRESADDFAAAETTWLDQERVTFVLLAILQESLIEALVEAHGDDLATEDDS